MNKSSQFRLKLIHMFLSFEIFQPLEDIGEPACFRQPPFSANAMIYILFSKANTTYSAFEGTIYQQSISYHSSFETSHISTKYAHVSASEEPKKTNRSLKCMASVLIVVPPIRMMIVRIVSNKI